VTATKAERRQKVDGFKKAYSAGMEAKSDVVK